MTASERANKIMCDLHATAHLSMGNTLPMNLLITEVIQSAEREMRERCAKVADELDGANETGISTAIRRLEVE